MDGEQEHEEHRRQEWMKYYVEIGDYPSARALGWDGEPLADGGAAEAGAGASGAASPKQPAEPYSEPELAAVRIQAHYRAHSQHERYKDDRNEAARLQWIEYYVATKQYDAVRTRPASAGPRPGRVRPPSSPRLAPRVL
jgi:hypothetical protein